MKILLTGPQGSGKTTQANIIAQKYNLSLIKTGDLVRKLATGDSKEAEEVRKQAIDEGVLVDDVLVARLVSERLAQPDGKEGFVMDGYPRRLSQLKLFDPGFDYVIYLDIDDKLAVKRMMERGRMDDTPELIKKRLEIYHKETEPVIHFYREAHRLIIVDGRLSVGEVTDQIIRILKDGKDTK